MRRGLRRPPAALAIAAIALFTALGGTVYAAGKLDGRQVKPKSMPGNRLVPKSLPANRLKPGSITGDLLAPGSVSAAQLAPGAVSPAQFAPGSITGNLVDAATLGQVPSAVHADTADSARDAQTALNAVNALDAVRINGYSAGCGPGTRFFAGACWQTTPSEAAVPAPTAAASCATQGGELPGALELAAFSQQPGIVLAPGDEWSGDLTNVSGSNLYAVLTVTASGIVSSDGSTANKRYRCVIPLLT
ncbi:MAG TPA: hypothetical protein VHA54_02765 [Solirubrobacterales bacterium]|nr:hypothetical protein [Solirubrobacterales bacterium]